MESTNGQLCWQRKIGVEKNPEDCSVLGNTRAKYLRGYVVDVKRVKLIPKLDVSSFSIQPSSALFRQLVSILEPDLVIMAEFIK